MKKLYRKGSVHPTPPLISDHLSFLPATILTLTVALSPRDREVLAYLISCSSSNNSSGYRRTSTTTSRTIGAASHGGGGAGADHPPSFNCYCFRCYMSYWVRWDSSPNRQLIHEIIDAFEDELLVQSKKEKSRKERKKSKGSGGSAELKRSEQAKNHELPSESDSVEESGGSGAGGVAGGEDGGGEEEEFDKGSVRRFVSFLGEKIWGVWT